MPLFIAFIFRMYNRHIVIHHSYLYRCRLSGRGISMGSRPEIQTRACFSACQRTTNWATLHPNEDDLPIGGYVQDRLAAAHMLQEKAGPLLADSPILVNIHFLRDNVPRFLNHVFPVLSSPDTLPFTERSYAWEKLLRFWWYRWGCLELISEKMVYHRRLVIYSMSSYAIF